jgi:hypothetical protein
MGCYRCQGINALEQGWKNRKGVTRMFIKTNFLNVNFDTTYYVPFSSNILSERNNNISTPPPPLKTIHPFHPLQASAYPPPLLSQAKTPFNSVHGRGTYDPKPYKRPSFLIAPFLDSPYPYPSLPSPRPKAIYSHTPNPTASHSIPF